MKTLAFFLTTVLVVVMTVVSQPVQGQRSEASVTGAGAGAFTALVVFNDVSLSSVEFGKGVLIAEDGTATGGFGITLRGNTARGQERTITMEGKASNGSVNSNGTATFSGHCTVDLGNGLAPLQGVPLIVTVTRGSLALTIGTVTLPTATVNAGSITIR